MKDDIILKLSIIHWGNCPWFWWCVLLGNSQNSFFHFGCWAKHFIKMPHSCYKTDEFIKHTHTWFLIILTDVVHYPLHGSEIQNNLPPLFPVTKSVCLGLVKSHRLQKKNFCVSMFHVYSSSICTDVYLQAVLGNGRKCGSQTDRLRVPHPVY